MNWLHWLTDDWFTALQSLAIVSGFAFTCITLRRDERSRRVTNLFQLTSHHQDVWSQVFTKPELRRVFSPDANLSLEPVTPDEKLFVSFLILHLNTAHESIKQGLMEPLEGLGMDIQNFFALPIPRAVWQDLRKFQAADFVAFVEEHLRPVHKAA